ncbi:hypothetical protein [Photobacterium ganghwense]|uniref:hypothetical protein n=1 Tax=Photobacterium ganghwense TaxID=320778 RepID=UPI001C2CF77A|nr:hypothetical protein [Photobacterium ganghwense]MBV1843595.1 hypothetical protein [Photobacterium ganghwense]
MQNSLTRTATFPALTRKAMKLSLPVMLAALFTLTQPVQASETTDNVASQAAATKATTQRINAIQRDLTSIRQQALKANPELVEQAKAFESAYKEKAQEIGYNPEEFIAQAQELQVKIRDEGLSEQERSDLLHDFAKAKQTLAKQRQTLLEDESLMALQNELQNNTLTAMKNHNPKTEELVSELNQLIESLQ